MVKFSNSGILLFLHLYFMYQNNSHSLMSKVQILLTDYFAKYLIYIL